MPGFERNEHFSKEKFSFTIDIPDGIIVERIKVIPQKVASKYDLELCS